MRIHKETSAFTAAVAALLFLAVCAYMGAGLFEKLSPSVQTLAAESMSITESARLYGIALRREQLLCSPEPPRINAENNRKYSAGELLCVFNDESSLVSPASAVYFDDTDGFEHLDPVSLMPFSADAFSAVMDSEEQRERHCFGRLVLDDVWYFAARVSQGSIPEKGSRCRICFDNISGSYQALVWAVDADCVLLRLNSASEELLSLRKCEAELVFGEYEGIEIPREALRRDSEGKLYVCVLSSGLVETRSVDIIYSDGSIALAEKRYSDKALREGELIVITEENSGEGICSNEYR